MEKCRCTYLNFKRARVNLHELLLRFAFATTVHRARATAGGGLSPPAADYRGLCTDPTGQQPSKCCPPASVRLDFGK